jgi:hypothetical protein
MNSFSIGIFLIYIASIISVIIVRYTNGILGSAIAVIISIIAFTMAALRPIHFPDYPEYVEIYLNASTGDFQNSDYWSSHGEPGFKIISYFISLIGYGSEGLMIFISFLSFILLLVTSQIGKVKFAYLWFTYLTMYFITRDLAAIRLGIASHLIVISVIVINKYHKILIGSFASFAFQYLAIIATLASFLSKIRPRVTILIFLSILSLISGWVLKFEDLINYIPSKQYDNYADTDHVMSGYGAVVLPFIRNISYTIVLYCFMIKKFEVPEYRLLIWLAFLSSMSYVAFSGIIIIAYRFSAYFGAIFPLAFAFILNDSKLSNSGFIFIFLMLIFSFFTGFYINNFIWLI